MKITHRPIYNSWTHYVNMHLCKVMGVLLGLSTCGVSGRCVNQFTWNSQSAYTQHMDYKWVMHTSVFPCSKLRLCLHYLCFVVWILWLRLMALASFRDTVAVSQWAVIYWQHWRNSCECERPWPYIPISLCWHAGVFCVLFTVVTHTHGRSHTDLSSLIMCASV